MQNKEDRLPGLGVLKPKDEKPTRQRSAERSPAGGRVRAPSHKELVTVWSAMPAQDTCSRCGGSIHTVLCPPEAKVPSNDCSPSHPGGLPGPPCPLSQGGLPAGKHAC